MVEGYTNPLWTLFMAFLHLLFLQDRLWHYRNVFQHDFNGPITAIFVLLLFLSGYYVIIDFSDFNV